LKHSPDTATPDDVRLFQLHLIESGLSICNRNRIMTGVRFLFRITLRRHDLAAEVYHLKEPQKLPLVMSPDDTKRLLAMARSIKVRVVLSLGYGCGLRAGEVVRLPRSGSTPHEQARFQTSQRCSSLPLGIHRRRLRSRASATTIPYQTSPVSPFGLRPPSPSNGHAPAKSP
jgi:site-specific recombinase XerD